MSPLSRNAELVLSAAVLLLPPWWISGSLWFALMFGAPLWVVWVAFRLGRDRGGSP